MAWLSVRIAADSKVADALSDALMEVGALSVSIEDALAGTDDEKPIFGEPGEPVESMWEQSIVVALLDEQADCAAIVREAASSIQLPEPHFTVETIAEQDWVRATQAQFDPIRISDRLWITPTWHEPPNPTALNLKLDPGLAFGTGSHPTTRLCLQWLDAHIQTGETVLDYGCGSGILAIAALKLGCGPALGVDIDPQAIIASQSNAEQNGVTAHFCLPDAMPEGEFDVVVANILANPLRMLGGMLAGRCRMGGRIVLSGILSEQAEELTQLYSQWFDMSPAIHHDGWVCLSGVKR